VALADDVLRVATFNTELSRKGPGLLLRDILTEQDPQVEAVAKIIAATRPDVLLLQGFDYDYDLLALAALQGRVRAHGWDLPNAFALRPNTGMATGLDLDADGRTGRPRDAQGFGEFSGQGGMAILSRYPVLSDEVRDFSDLLWVDMPDALLLKEDGAPLLSSEVAKVQRLATVAHWVVPIIVQDQKTHLLTFHASPPVFDGPEDRNGRRNHDEIVFWLHYLDGQFGPIPETPLILLGDANLDPVDGDGRKSAIHRLLQDERLQDPAPRRDVQIDEAYGHQGDPALDTAEWPGPDPGHLRVSYILPSQDLQVIRSGVFDPIEMKDVVESASRHRLIWVDMLLQ